MAKPKGGLGRGLDSLISNNIGDSTNDRLTMVAINDIKPGRYQPRVQMDDAALQELAESIKAQGVIQPVIVRERGLSQYELIAGERRWRASQLAGLTEIPVVIKSISDETALAMARTWPRSRGRRARCTGQRARRARAGRGSPPRCAGTPCAGS